MGRLKNGPFSGFTGRTGSLVGSRKNGKWIMAAVRATAPGTPSELQRNQQMKFGMMTSWLSWINGFLKLVNSSWTGTQLRNAPMSIGVTSFSLSQQIMNAGHRPNNLSLLKG